MCVACIYCIYWLYCFSSFRGCDAFSDSCQKALEPEDVTVGLVIGKCLRCYFMIHLKHTYDPLLMAFCKTSGTVLHQELSRTEMIYTHGLDLMSTVPSPYIAEQVYKQ